MPIDFHDKRNQNTYSSRQADLNWLTTIKAYITKESFVALDLGCGGGIYSKALSELGARHVIGMDFSESNLEGAKQNCTDYPNIDFMLGDAINTSLPSKSVDLILERALIHHINNLDECFSEANRVLRENGLFIIQDRTSDDCSIAGDQNHIRGYFFEKFPELFTKELARRHSNSQVINSLLKCDFEIIAEKHFWETRKIYSEIDHLLEDIRNRTGRSILHELSDEEILELVDYIRSQLNSMKINKVVEKDRWTIWIARLR